MNLMAWLEPEFCLRLTWTLVHFLWQGVAIAALVMLFDWSLRGAAPNLRYSIHVGALVLMVACLPIIFALVNIPRPESPPIEAAFAMGASPPAASTVDLAADEVKLSPTTEPLDSPDEDQIVSAPPVHAEQNQKVGFSVVRTFVPPEGPASRLARAAPYAAAIYLIGLCAMLLRFAVGLWGGHRLRTGSVLVSDANLLAMLHRLSDRLRLRVKPAIAVCQRVSVPIVIGVVKPVILLPSALVTSLTAQQLEALLTHELAHIRRCDLLVNMLQRLIESALFFHPAVWCVSRRVSIEREHACDDFVVLCGWRKIDYAAALVRMAELCAALPPARVGALAASGNKPSQFKLRIQRLMNTAEDSRLRLTRVGMAGLLVTLALLIASPSIAHSLAQDQPPIADAESIDPGQLDEPGKPNAPAQPLPTHSKQAGAPTLQEPAFLLPDHWIVESVGFDNMSKELVTASKQSFVTIRRWDVVDRKLISEIKLTSDKHARPVNHHTLTLSGDCRRVVAATDEYVGIWDTATGKLLKTLPIPKKEWAYDCVRCLACTPDLSLIVAGLGTSYDRTTLVYDGYGIVWDGDSGEVLQTVSHKHGYYFGSIVVSPDGKRFATHSEHGGGASIWDTSTGKMLHAVSIDKWKSSDPKVINRHFVHSVQFSPDGKQLAVGGTLGVQLVDVRSGKALRRIDAPHRYGRGRLAFSPDGRLLARTGTSTKRKERIVQIWSSQTGDLLHQLHTASNTCAFSDDGNRIAVAFSDRKMAVAVFELSGKGAEKEQADGPAPESNKDKVAENTHSRGERAAKFVDDWKPVWGDERLGIQFGIAMTTSQRQFGEGERVLMAAFIRNASAKPLQIDLRPDFFWNLPKVVNAKGEGVEFEKLALLGRIPHYRDKLQPGKAFGPLYFNFGLGDNPRPGKQNWHPYFKAPVAGKYKLTHTLSVKVADPKASKDQTNDDWKGGELTSGTIEFEIAKEESAKLDVELKKAQFQQVNIRVIGGKKKQPLRSMTVKANRELAEDTAATGLTDMNGNVALKLRPGVYYIDLQPKEDVPYLGLPIGYKRNPYIYSRWIRVNEQKNGQEFTFHLADACELTLRAVDADTGKGIPGITFVMENIIGEYYALPINGDNLGAKSVSNLGDEALKTDRAGVFRRLMGPREGWTCYVWKFPDEYEQVTRGEEVEIDTRLGKSRVEYTFKFRRKPAKSMNSD